MIDYELKIDNPGYFKLIFFSDKGGYRGNEVWIGSGTLNLTNFLDIVGSWAKAVRIGCSFIVGDILYDDTGYVFYREDNTGDYKVWCTEAEYDREFHKHYIGSLSPFMAEKMFVSMLHKIIQQIEEKA